MSTPASTSMRFGRFSLSSSTVVVTDPGYLEKWIREDKLGDFVERCVIGEWRVELSETFSQDIVPSTVLASLDTVTLDLTESDWKRIGTVGIFDLSHFHDASIVPSGQKWTYDGAPADPNDLWYSLVCEAVRDRRVSLVPFGLAVHWDSEMDIDVYAVESRIVAIRLSIPEA